MRGGFETLGTKKGTGFSDGSPEFATGFLVKLGAPLSTFDQTILFFGSRVAFFQVSRRRFNRQKVGWRPLCNHAIPNYGAAPQ
jgi:hypothetical protein